MKNSLLFSLLFMLAIATNAQSKTDLVYLRGGSILKGTLLENSDTLLKIKIVGDKIFAFKPNEIEKIITHGNTSKYSGQLIRYQCLISAGSLVGSSKNEKEAPISLLTEQNMGISTYFSFGLTTGLEIPNESVIPIGGNIKGFLPLNSGNILFAGLSAGYLKSLEKPNDPYNMITENSNGTFANAEIGIIFTGASQAKMFMALGYRYAELHYRLNNWWYTEMEENMYFNRMSVRIGVFID